jgi:hypothetical protein
MINMVASGMHNSLETGGTFCLQIDGELEPGYTDRLQRFP